jgi:CRP-like cAMP-binding protein
VVKPWLESEAISVIGEVTWTAEQETTIAELGPEFARQVAASPQVGAALLDRALARTQRFAVSEGIATTPGVEERLLLMLWHLADRWGRVTPDGIVVPVVLTHRLLAALVGASRPTVSSAVADLTRRGCLARRNDRTWLLLGDPPEDPRVLEERQLQSVAARRL